MIRAWRLSSSRHPPLSGDGARLVGGRWNSPGIAVSYASESIALCLAECLVHITGRLPMDYVSVRLSFPDDAIELLDRTTLKEDWRDDLGYTRAIGDEWIRQNRSLALGVPSVILPESTNILINHGHSQYESVVIEETAPFEFDPRLQPLG